MFFFESTLVFSASLEFDSSNHLPSSTAFINGIIVGLYISNDAGTFLPRLIRYN
jgi:hypothetical protein